MIQFLIGVMQTCFAPGSDDWDDYREQPPSAEILKNHMEPEADAFELCGDGPRFMQDLYLHTQDQKNEAQIGSLFIDEPGDNTIRQNTDFFVKRGRITAVCAACAAAGLYTLQTNAPSGGQGHRTSLRGGGPLTTLIMGETLWETIWHNVLDHPQLETLSGEMNSPRKGGIYPWLSATETSEGGRGTYPSQKHPLHMFWAMPRRIRLIFEESKQFTCDICGNHAGYGVSRYWVKNLGYNYLGPWQHPLTPYRQQSENEPYSIKGSPSGIRYQHWVGIIDRSPDDAAVQQMPAKVVNVFRDERAIEVRESGGPDYRVWAFGYDLDNMKARAWVEGVVPVYEIKNTLRSAYAAWIERYIRCAGQVAYNLRQAIKKGAFAPKKEIKSDNTFLNALELRFWTGTEDDFFHAVRILRDILESGANAPDVQDREDWLWTLFRKAREIFGDAVSSGEFEAEKHQRVALAWNDLIRLNSPRVKFFREALDLATSKNKTA
jgi:CRISPR system Cascade subunit CasA